MWRLAWPVARSALHTSLERLEAKGFMPASTGSPTTGRMAIPALAPERLAEEC